MNCKRCGKPVHRAIEGELICPSCWAWGQMSDEEREHEAELAELFQSNPECAMGRCPNETFLDQPYCAQHLAPHVRERVVREVVSGREKSDADLFLGSLAERDQDVVRLEARIAELTAALRDIAPILDALMKQMFQGADLPQVGYGHVCDVRYRVRRALHIETDEEAPF